MKKTVGLYAARAATGNAYIYNQKLIPQGSQGVHTVDGDFPSSGSMVNAKGLFELMGIPFPEGATFELDITVTEPRKHGWYPVIWKLHNSKRLLHYDGTTFNSSTDENATSWREDELSWIADEPIPDPFDIPLKPLECVKVTQREDGYYAATNRDRQVTWIIQSKDDAWYYYHGGAFGDTDNMKIGTKPIPKECLP